MPHKDFERRKACGKKHYGKGLCGLHYGRAYDKRRVNKLDLKTAPLSGHRAVTEYR